MTSPPAAIADLPWAVWVIALPLVAATAAFVRGRHDARLGLAASIGVVAAVAGLTWQVWRNGPGRYSLGGWGAPLGIDLYVDGLSVVMLLTTAAVGLPVGVYATGYFARHAGGHGAARSEGFWPLWLFLWGSMNALFLSGDIFNLYVTLELVTLAAVGLVALAGSAEAIAAALRYLIAAVLGSLAYLLGVALLYSAYGTLDIASLGRVITPGSLPAAAATLMAVGLGVKTALFPLHFWLPPAHANAPAPVSALLSGLVVKASFYLLLRLWFDAFTTAASPAAGDLLGSLGSAAILWGSVQALLAARLKTLVAYSTVAQLGYLFLLFGLAVPGGVRADAWFGGVLFAVSHACAKSAMFLAAGSVLDAAGHDRLADLEGTARRLPVTFLTIGAASVTLMGLPPSGAFVAKWILLGAALENGQGWLAAVIVGGGLLAAAYLFPVLAIPLRGSSMDPPLSVPRSMEWTALALALGALLLGLVATPFLHLVGIGTPSIAGAMEAGP